MKQYYAKPLDDDDFETVIIDGQSVKVLKDGHSFRVPMTMADARSPSPHLHDGRGGPVGHRPGFAFTIDSAISDAKRRLYDEYDAEISQAYTSPPTGFGSREFIGQREGDLCTINGAQGRLRRGPDGQLVCVPDQRKNDCTAADARETAYSAYEADITNAWRGKTP